MNDMIERVAKAINDTMINYGDYKPIGLARAAIKEMRNCTPAMLDAGSAAHPAGGYTRGTLLNDIIECEWWAMCDAALECSTKPDEQ